MPISSRTFAFLLCVALPAHAQTTKKSAPKPATIKAAPKTAPAATQSEVSPLPAPDVEFAAPVIAPARAGNAVAPATTAVVGDLAQFLSGKLVPLNIKLSEMKTGWQSLRVLRAEEKNAAPASAPRSPDDFYQDLISRFGSENNRYFTQGQTLRFNDDTHLVVYRAQFPDEKTLGDYFEAQLAAYKNKPVTAEIILPVTHSFLDTIPVRASLLNTRNISAMEDVATFDFDKQFVGFSELVNRELRHSAEMQQQQNAALRSDSAIENNLKQVFAGIEQYSQDTDEKLPPLQDLATARKAIDPYINNKGAWMDTLKIKLHPNALLSGKALAHLKPYASSMILFYSDADAQGERWVLRLDGQVRQVSGAQWPQLKKAARIP